MLVFIWSPSSLFQFESVISTEAWQCQQGWEKLREKKETLFGKISKNSIAPQRHRNHLWFHTIDTLCIRKKKVLEFQTSKFCLCKKVNMYHISSWWSILKITIWKICNPFQTNKSQPKSCCFFYEKFNKHFIPFW